MEGKNSEVEALKAQVAELTTMLENTRKSQSGSDRQVAIAQSKIKDLESRLIREGAENELLGRVNRVVLGLKEKQRQLEILYFTKLKCLDARVDFRLVEDIPFPDEQAAEKKIQQLAKYSDEIIQIEQQERMLGVEKPRSGINPEPKARTPFDEIITRELGGLSFNSSEF